MTNFVRIAIATTLVAAVAAPAFAGLGDPNQPTFTYDAKRDKYCMSTKVTGYYLPQKQCRTKDEWAKLGITFDQQSPANGEQVVARLAQK